ncbi:hypothetical protein STENM36S_07347 [Streptomyces tendae]
MLGGPHELRPQLALGAQHPGGRLRRRRCEVHVVDGAQVDDHPGLGGRFAGARAARVVEVGRAVVGVHDLVSAQGRRPGVRRFAPAHHRAVQGEGYAALGPDHRPASGAHQVLGQPRDEPGVQRTGTRQPLPGGAGPRRRAPFPLRGGDLVPADVHVRRGEDVHHLVQDGAEEVQDVLAGAQDVLAHAPARPHVQSAGGVGAQLGVGGQGGADVPRHAGLRQYAHAPLRRVRDQVPQLGTGVGAAVRHAVEPVAARGAHHRLRAPAADLGEPGTGGHRHPPALVVGEVEVEDVQLVQREQVDVAPQIGHRLEVPGHVEHGTAPGVAGYVGDLHGRQLPRHPAHRPPGQGVVGHELPHRLHSAQEPGRAGGPQQGALGAHGQAVPLLAEAGQRRVEGEHEGAVGRGVQAQPGGRGEEGAQQGRGRTGPRGDPQPGRAVEAEAAGAGGEAAGTGDEGQFGAWQVHGATPVVGGGLRRAGGA